MPIINVSDLDDSTLRGEEHGASISIILDESGPGGGPRLHKHPYDETWIVEEGQIAFQVGDQIDEVGPGEIVIVPPNAPHKFTNRGPGQSRLVCIHASPRMITEWLE